jgi:hypothetical protein
MRKWDVPIGTKMYILFGQEASEMYFNGEPVEEILRLAQDGDIKYDLYIFENGVTNPANLLSSFVSGGWKDYCVLDNWTDFEILNTAGQ